MARDGICELAAVSLKRKAVVNEEFLKRGFF